MDLRKILDSERNEYNQLVTHVIQSFEWGEFRKSLGLPLLRYGLYKNGKLTKAFQLTLHKIPFFNQYVGYLPKGPLPDKELAQALEQIQHYVFTSEGKKLCFIKLEPNIEVTTSLFSVHPKFLPSPKPLFTKYNFLIDLKQSEKKLLENMHPKTRYNIKLAQKKGVVVEERTDDKAFKVYLKLYFDTTKRQHFLGHDENYHYQVWRNLRDAGMARLLIGYYKKSPLSAWMLINFKDTIYYPYGGSATKHKEVMASNLVAWEAIRLGKRLGCKKFDMWGAANSSNPNINDQYFGFHTFKKGYGGKLVEYIGTYDLIFNNPLYFIFTTIDRLTSLKVFLLRLLR